MDSIRTEAAITVGAMTTAIAMNVGTQGSRQPQQRQIQKTAPPRGDLSPCPIWLQQQCTGMRCGFGTGLHENGQSTIQTLASWYEIADGNINRISQNLSALAGHEVRIVNTLKANGDATDDLIHLLAPVVQGN